jgi:hypothetical protein
MPQLVFTIGSLLVRDWMARNVLNHGELNVGGPPSHAHAEAMMFGSG